MPLFFIERIFYMNELANSIRRQCEIYMSRHDLEKEYELEVVYYNPKEKEDCFAYVLEKANCDEIRELKPFSNDEEPDYIAEWAYNIDDYDFESLQEGYEIAYISMAGHYNFWCMLEQWMPDDIQNIEGMQKYLTYCKTNGITKELIETMVGLELKEDAMKYYVEQNQGYTIISEINIDDHSILLGENKNAPSPYVTWKTTPSREDGYTSGQYFSSEKEAKRNFMKRANNEVREAVQKELDLPTNEKGEER